MMLFLYTVGRMEPRSAGNLPGISPNSTLHRSRTTSSVLDDGDFTGCELWEAASDSLTSQRFPFSSKATRVWLFVSPFVSKYVSMIIGGGRLSVALHVFQVASWSLSASVSSNSTLNYIGKGRVSSEHFETWETMNIPSDSPEAYWNFWDKMGEARRENVGLLERPWYDNSTAMLEIVSGCCPKGRPIP